MTTESVPHSPAPEPTAHIDYDALPVGLPLPPIPLVVWAADVEDYREAVGTAEAHDTISSTQLLALMMAAITERMPLPPTCVHVGQELEWSRAVAPGTPLTIHFGLVSRRTAGGSTLSAFFLRLSAPDGEVARGRILLQS